MPTTITPLIFSIASSVTAAPAFLWIHREQRIHWEQTSEVSGPLRVASGPTAGRGDSAGPQAGGESPLRVTVPLPEGGPLPRGQGR